MSASGAGAEDARAVEPRAMLPGWLRAGIFLLVAGSLLAAATVRPTTTADGRAVPYGEGTPVAERELRFIDLAGGSVGILDAVDNREIARLGTGEGGFMRSVMRGLALERVASGHGDEVPFRLSVWESGLVTLVDPVTGRQVALSAFGPDNVSAFTRLL